MRPRVAVEVEEARQVIERKKIEAGRVWGKLESSLSLGGEDVCDRG